MTRLLNIFSEFFKAFFGQKLFFKRFSFAKRTEQEKFFEDRFRSLERKEKFLIEKLCFS